MLFDLPNYVHPLRGPASAGFSDFSPAIKRQLELVPLRGVSSQVLDSGGAYRVSPTQQIDIRVGIGLNRAAPDYLFGLGYSFRFDNLF